jgi:hypothetical protein
VKAQKKNTSFNYKISTDLLQYFLAFLSNKCPRTRNIAPYVVADLYQKRWRIEEAFFLVKRLLNLSYLWTGSLNGIKLQIGATWLFYAVLVDLGDAGSG